MDLALFLVRLIVGLAMAAHGTQKLFGWFGGYGIAGTGGFMESIGFRPGRLFATAAGLGETAGGLLVALGFLGPVGPALMVLVMIVAALSVHAAQGFFAAHNGVEVPVLYGVVAFALAFTGPGAYSLDAALGLTTLTTATHAWVALAVAVVGALLNLAVRRPAPAAEAAAGH
ncbi:MAG TPA: DoxX family protein [Thermoanaerobaculia bacterium]|nr:DoxX family protein [Thermoanaerobaculia bacterium]